jgi:hypothetical protein
MFVGPVVPVDQLFHWSSAYLNMHLAVSANTG